MSIKSTLIASLVLISSYTYANQASQCHKVQRATTFDQKTMATDVAQYFLGITSNNIITITVDNYVSWKGKQVDCLANVFHYGDILVLEEDNGYICRTDLSLHTKDSFVEKADFVRDYKPRNVIKNCFEPNLEMALAMKTCNSMPACPRIEGVSYKRDIFDSCKCKSLDDRVKYENVQADYVNFFDPANKFTKPASIETAFD